ncbi:MAG: hypothetical protein GY793_04800 [Proteobacteria bacterium]|nr:hypothetical protein [Pseudomonadota bacterium]
MRRSIFAVIVLFFVCSVVYANNDAQLRAPRGITVLYGNGMSNLPEEAALSADLTWRKVRKIYKKGLAKGYTEDDIKHLTVDILYNKSEARVISDWYHFAQYVDGWHKSAFKFLGTLETGANYGAEFLEAFRQVFLDIAAAERDLSMNNDLEPLMRDYLGKEYNLNPEEKAALQNVAQKFSALTEAYKDDDLKAQIAKVRTILDSGKCIMAAVHSQGNIYMQKIFNAFLSIFPKYEDSYRILSVGSPINISCDDAYIRDERDPITKFSLQKANVRNTRRNGKKISIKSSGRMVYHKYDTYLRGNDSSKYFTAFFIKSLNDFYPEAKVVKDDPVVIEDDSEVIRITLEKVIPDDPLSLFLAFAVDGEQVYPKRVGKKLVLKPKNSKEEMTLGTLESSWKYEVYTLHFNELPKKYFKIVAAVSSKNWPGYTNRCRITVETADGVRNSGKRDIEGQYVVSASRNGLRGEISQGFVKHPQRVAEASITIKDDGSFDIVNKLL